MRDEGREGHGHTQQIKMNNFTDIAFGQLGQEFCPLSGARLWEKEKNEAFAWILYSGRAHTPDACHTHLNSKFVFKVCKTHTATA